MGRFDYPWDEQEEPRRAKVTTIYSGDVTPEEEEQAFEELYQEIRRNDK